MLSISHRLQNQPIPLRPNRSQSALGEESNNDKTYFKVTGKEKKAAVRVSLIISVWSSVMDPSIIKAEVWNDQGSYFALCRTGAKEKL